MASTEKHALRRQARLARRRLDDRPARSETIIRRLQQQDGYARAQAILYYVSAGCEVDTHEEIRRVLAEGQRRVVVPYCLGADLALVELRHWSELATGAYGVLEPAIQWRQQAWRNVAEEQVDVVIVPGVAFSKTGARLGHGQGYYDRLLSRLSRSTVTIGLGFDCQVFDLLPRQPHDMPVSMLLTESEVYQF